MNYINFTPKSTAKMVDTVDHFCSTKVLFSSEKAKKIPVRQTIHSRCFSTSPSSENHREPQNKSPHGALRTRGRRSMTFGI